ncbi:MAG: sigma-70 family RNA polymerase sigma factor [Acidobacteriaceae bacterium]|nr:sigma-70 family RNA polymerase sigma factor [Acidobacteriaceae bacterium]
MADTSFGLHLDASAGTYPSLEDQALLDALRKGSEQAYETLIVRYQQPVYNLVCRLLGESADSADIVQEVFLKIFRNIRSFRGNSSLKTWVYRIAVNEAYNHRRWFTRHQRQEVGLVREESARSYEDSLADPGRSPFDLTLDHETRALVEDALAKLNPNFRAAVVLRDIEDLSYEEIAVVLDVSIGTVKSRILRGREALRKVLEARLEPEPSFGWSPQTVE